MSVKILANVFEFCDLSSTYKLMLLALADHADDYGVAYPSVKRLAHKCRCSARQAKNILKKLEEMGEIKRIEKKGAHTNGGITNRYILNEVYVHGAKNTPQKPPKNNIDEASEVVKSGVTENDKVVKSSAQGGEIQRKKDALDFTLTINRTKKESIDPETQSVVGVTKSHPVQKRSPYDYNLSDFQVDETKTMRGGNWLIGIAKQMWGRELSETQIKELQKSVRAVIGSRIGDYPSPIEYAHDEKYSNLFREWVLSKKDPRKDTNISVGGMKKWIKHHICNYDSPEGFLNWLNKVHGINLAPETSKAVAAVRKYTLVEMDMFVHNRVRPNDELLISKDFREFYQENIELVKTNEEFLKLWQTKDAE